VRRWSKRIAFWGSDLVGGRQDPLFGSSTFPAHELVEAQRVAERRGRELLDRIDEIVPPGTILNPADVGWQPLALRDTGARRRRM
jgi:hypothetical protein